MQIVKSLNIYVISIGFGLFGLLASSLEGAVAGAATIPRLVAEADVIILGTVDSVEAVNVPGNPGAGRLVLSVNEVYKGNYANGLLYLSYGPVMSTGDEQTMRGDRILAFGKLSGDGQSYVLLPTTYGPGAILRHQIIDASSAASVPAIQINVQDTPLQKVIKEIGLIQIGSTTSEGSPYLSSLPFARIEPDLTEAVFKAILASGPQGVAVGTAGLVKMGGISGLQAADLIDIQDHPELSPIVSDIGSYNRDTSQAGFQILVRWLGPSVPAVKRAAAAGALASIHTPGAVLQLGTALNDSDFEIRWRAIGGLSMFANNVPLGGVSPAAGVWPFRSADTIKFSVFDRNVVNKDEARYLTFWRQWWDQNQGQIQTLANTQAP
jgi:hypothetical protein